MSERVDELFGTKPAAPRLNGARAHGFDPDPDRDSFASLGADDSPPVLPEIVIDVDELRVNDEALAALERLRVNGDPFVYRRGPHLVRVVRGGELPRGVVARDADAPSIDPVPSAVLGEQLTAAAQWVRLSRDKEGNVRKTRAHPPKWTRDALRERKAWPTLPHLEAIVESPVLLASGEILATPGYDKRSGLLLAPSCSTFPDVPAKPTRDDARAAAALLVDVLVDFPFKGEEHRAAALAAVIAPHARFAHSGPAPLVVLDASTAASGKSLQADVIGLVALGRRPARMAHVLDDAEQEKRILALGICGERIVVIDNLVGVLGGASLCAALTATTFGGRILGRTETIKVPMLAQWIATGNNVQLAPDMSRRSLHVRLEPRCERPEERSGFAHPDLLAHVARERPRLVVAVLTILRAHALAGRPDGLSDGLSPWGSFEGWSSVVRAAVAWATDVDPGAAREGLRVVADVELESVRALVTGWVELVKFTGGRDASAREAVGRLYPDRGAECPTALLELRDAVEDLTRAKPGQAPSPRVLGRALAKYRGRVIDGFALDGQSDGHEVMRWRSIGVSP